MQKYFTDNAYLIHSRKYTDSKILVSFVSESNGKFSGVLRIRKSKAKQSITPQLFVLFHVEWQGVSNLKSINLIEPVIETSARTSLEGQSLFCGIYLNELLERLLLEEDNNHRIFRSYQLAIENLANASNKIQRESALRVFEFCLLEELGYGVEFICDVNGDLIDDGNRQYGFEAGLGFRPVQKKQLSQSIFSAEILMQIMNQEFENPEALKAAKVICRKAIEPLLNNKPLKSRELFN